MSRAPRADDTFLFAGHRFSVHTDADFRARQTRHLREFAAPETPVPPCGETTELHVHHDAGLFGDRMAQARGKPSERIMPFRGEPYRLTSADGIRWWWPDPESGLPNDHLYARDRSGELQVVLRPDADRGERYAMRVVREIVLRCAEERGWAAYHAAAASVDGQGVLVAGPAGAGKTTVLAALAAHRNAALVAADRALVTPGARYVVGVPISVRIAGGTLTGLGQPSVRQSLVPLSAAFGHTSKAAFTPHGFANAFGVRLQERAPLRSIVLPRLNDSDDALTVSSANAATRRSALLAACCTPADEDWLHPWFRNRNRTVSTLAHQAMTVIEDMVSMVPVLTLTAGTRVPHLLERIAETLARRLT